MRTGTTLGSLTLATALLCYANPLAQSPAPSPISESRYIEHVKFLASDALGGRGNGSPGLDRAAQYIADQFRADGLKPGVNGSWFQPFQIVTGLEVREGNRLAIAGEKSPIAFELGQTYFPLSVGPEPAGPAAAEAPPLRMRNSWN